MLPLCILAALAALAPLLVVFAFLARAEPAAGPRKQARAHTKHVRALRLVERVNVLVDRAESRGP
eukprot:8410919-Lingulodinium_polyedra.AAC.1